MQSSVNGNWWAGVRRENCILASLLAVAAAAAVRIDCMLKGDNVDRRLLDATSSRLTDWLRGAGGRRCRHNCESGGPSRRCYGRSAAGQLWWDHEVVMASSSSSSSSLLDAECMSASGTASSTRAPTPSLLPSASLPHSVPARSIEAVLHQLLHHYSLATNQPNPPKSIHTMWSARRRQPSTFNFCPNSLSHACRPTIWQCTASVSLPRPPARLGQRTDRKWCSVYSDLYECFQLRPDYFHSCAELACIQCESK